MNKTMLKRFGNTVAAIIATALLAPAAANADNLDDPWWGVDPIEGLWDARVTITNCADGSPTPLNFAALGLFGRGGTFNNTDALNPLMPTMRSSIFGTWKRLRGRTYEVAFKLFRFDVAGTLIGTQVVRHTLTLSRDGNSYVSAGTSQAYDVNGNPISTPPTGCSTATGTRFR